MHAARILVATLALVALAPAGALAQEGPPGGDARRDALIRRLQALQPKKGSVVVGANLATLSLPEGYGYLDQSDARFVVEDLWENPPNPDILGFVIPPGVSVVGEGSWGIIVSFDADGYVQDDEAKTIDYAALLTDMQSDSRASNKERKKRGYPAVDLLGWAEPPHYDGAARKLYWAKRLQFEGNEAPTLNYDVRILGRRGVLVMQAVADDGQLAQVATGCKQVLEQTRFTQGNRYEDFDPKLDKVAAYGLGGLIAGKVLLKGGMIKGLGKLIVLAVAAVAGLGAKLFGKKEAAPSSPGSGSEGGEASA